jgi:DNA polymerase
VDAQLRERYMRAMGIPVWKPKQAEERIPLVPPFSKGEAFQPVSDFADKVPPFEKGGAGGIYSAKPDTVSTQLPNCSNMDWNELRSTVLACTRCEISKTRTQAVFGVGDPQARWMIIGEAPGADEDRKGEPFVGKAGQLLNNMLAAIGMPRESVYIANVLKCRPPNNRDPKVDEAANCRGYLERQIELVNPALILVVGRIAAQNLLQTDAPLARLRGREHLAPLSRTSVIVTYHPAYLLRQPSDKRKAWQDLCFAREVFARHAG